ncbi:SDR family NAD(P)-dependent oxidoreductase [Rhodococcus koreensis]
MEGIIQSGATAVVTGAGSGIGRGLVLELARHGMDVVLAGRRKERLEKVADTARTHGVKALAVRCDVSEPEEVLRLRDAAHEEFGKVDLLCLNAATTTAGPLIEHSLQDWDWVYRTVLMGVVHGVHAFVPSMAAAGGGHVLITGSISGLVPDAFDHHGPYSSAKAAVNALAMTLRPELESSGIGVSLLLPAWTKTDMVETSAFRPSRESIPAPDLMQIVPRPGLPEPLPGTETFLEPEEVARRAISGVQRNLPIIASHSGQRPMVEEYCWRIVDAFREDWSLGPAEASAS